MRSVEAKDLPTEALRLADLECRKDFDLQSVFFRPYGVYLTVEMLYTELARRMNGFVN